ncbi:hypothetical protein Hanom_Chr07g00596191 [Helianthus anomalus]
MGLFAEWRGAVGWGFGCVFLFVSLGTLGRCMVWDPQNFLLSIESVDGKVGNWVGGIMGIAEIRCTTHTWVVFWLLQPFLRALCCVLVFDKFFFSCFRMCITLLRSLFLCECSLNSVFECWVLGIVRLGISLYLGVIRHDQIFVFFIYWFLLNVGFFSTKQRSENLWLGQKPVCVVFFEFSWIGTVVPLGGGVSFWVLGGIRDSKAIRVVILLKLLCLSSEVIFHSVLILCLLGNLNLFFCFVVSLKGSLTILTTSAAVYGRLGVNVLWGGTHHGDTRLEIATMIRTLFFTPKLVFYFLDLISGNQSLQSLFLSKPVSCFIAVNFCFVDPLGYFGVWGILGWVGGIRWQGCYGNIMCVMIPFLLDRKCKMLIHYQRNIWTVLASSLQGCVGKYSNSLLRLHVFNDVTSLVRLIWDSDLVAGGNVADVLRLLIWFWMFGRDRSCWQGNMIIENISLREQGYFWNSKEMIVNKFWGLNIWFGVGMEQSLKLLEYIRSDAVLLQVYIWKGHLWNIEKSYSEWQLQKFKRNVYSCKYKVRMISPGLSCWLLLIWILKTWAWIISVLLRIWCYWDLIGGCKEYFFEKWVVATTDGAGYVKFVRNEEILQIWKGYMEIIHILELGLEIKIIKGLMKTIENKNQLNQLIGWVIKHQLKSTANEIMCSYAGYWCCKLRGVMGSWTLWDVKTVKLKGFRKPFGYYAENIMDIQLKTAWIICLEVGWNVDSAYMRYWVRGLIIKRLGCKLLSNNRMSFNDLVSVWPRWGEINWVVKAWHTWLWALGICGIAVMWKIVYWDVSERCRLKSSQRINCWCGQLDWAYSRWFQWDLPNYVWNWTDVRTSLKWPGGWDNVNMWIGCIKRQWAIFVLGHRHCDPAVDMLKSVKACCVDRFFSLSLRNLFIRIWVYVMGLCWPVGFRFGLSCLYRVAHGLCFLFKAKVGLGYMSRI